MIRGVSWIYVAVWDEAPCLFLVWYMSFIEVHRHFCPEICKETSRTPIEVLPGPSTNMDWVRRPRKGNPYLNLIPGIHWIYVLIWQKGHFGSFPFFLFSNRSYKFMQQSLCWYHKDEEYCLVPVPVPKQYSKWYVKSFFSLPNLRWGV